MLRMKSVISIILLFAVLLIILLFAVLLSGCVEKEQGVSNLSKQVQATPKELMIPENAKKVVELAKNDLAARLNISGSSVTVEDVIPEEWPDTSLGYPEPDKAYAQVITPGYVIFLYAEGETYEYHSNYTRIAPPPEPVKEPNEKIPNRTEQSKVVELAKKDLAAKLNIPDAGVQVLRVIPTEWPDTSLGYPEPEKVYAQVITPGYVILLQAEGSTIYGYHSDYERVVAPPGLQKGTINVEFNAHVSGRTEVN